MTGNENTPEAKYHVTNSAVPQNNSFIWKDNMTNSRKFKVCWFISSGAKTVSLVRNLYILILSSVKSPDGSDTTKRLKHVGKYGQFHVKVW